MGMSGHVTFPGVNYQQLLYKSPRTHLSCQCSRPFTKALQYCTYFFYVSTPSHSCSKKNWQCWLSRNWFIILVVCPIPQKYFYKIFLQKYSNVEMYCCFHSLARGEGQFAVRWQESILMPTATMRRTTLSTLNTLRCQNYFQWALKISWHHKRSQKSRNLPALLYQN